MRELKARACGLALGYFMTMIMTKFVYAMQAIDKFGARQAMAHAFDASKPQMDFTIYD